MSSTWQLINHIEDIIRTFCIVIPSILAGAVWRYKNCRVPRCFGLSEYPVIDTTWKVCAAHHTPEMIEFLQKLYRFKNPG